MKGLRKSIFWGLYVLAVALPLLASSPKASLYKMIPTMENRSSVASLGALEGGNHDVIAQTVIDFAVAEWDRDEGLGTETVALAHVSSERSF
ncbi:MAG: hypothetical protein A3I75_01830 [Deltaproteobacteria bacterium RIFCSPLOWO2_02_FULL_50_16]|nr:MAG: hypothetical protein A2053_06205 [Deltaproteobacteria bacterium GWA2_50_8]OGQ26261.1 MAG: hypothetical protein A3B79_06400 [Deltaproteobacteria bacterium RIFCSPHIGHO2_02_FULL_50_15]OGQ56272.1 MAG: hypothetical protein A3I75_01830 [Deltaproteobacteria bacterium RIFCSPLOWO2_02_FULL_50_16]OGQ65843.1 MAG: hypothetical protein A3F89_07755 [Deltaproteobacteria bacterium RIFCSPLOWO2_12_FULL_50_11]